MVKGQARCLFFLRSADGEVGTFVTWDGTRDEDDSILFADGDDLKVLDSGFGGAHVAGHLLVFPDTTWGRAGGDGAGTAVHHVTVSHWLAVEFVAFDHTLEAAADGFADDINILTSSEEGEAGMLGRNLGAVFKTEFLDYAFWCGTGFLKAGEIRFVYAELFLIIETNLNGGVAVGFDGFRLEKGVSGNVDDGYGNAGARFFIEDAGHADFFTEESE